MDRRLAEAFVKFQHNLYDLYTKYVTADDLSDNYIVFPVDVTELAQSGAYFDDITEQLDELGYEVVSWSDEEVVPGIPKIWNVYDIYQHDTCCESCGKMISKEYEYCPHCGSKIWTVERTMDKWVEEIIGDQEWVRSSTNDELEGSS